MKKIYLFYVLWLVFGINLWAQTLTVEQPIVNATQNKYKAVIASSMLHAIEGSSVVYNIKVAGYDSIESVKSLKYNDIDITSYCHLNKGTLTIDAVKIDDLKANTIQQFNLALAVREKGKDFDTERSASAMLIKVYSVPSDMEVEAPDYLTYYKDTERDLTWKFKGKGGNNWNCIWTVNGATYSANKEYVCKRIKSSYNSIIKLVAVNYAPDGVTEWERHEENWEILVLPEAKVTPSVENGTNKEFFQDQEWPFSVMVNGGNSSKWEYHWTVDGKEVATDTKEYILLIKENERTTSVINKRIRLTVKNTLPTGTKPTNEQLEWTYNYNAKFYPCPEIKFAENYPHNICDGDQILFDFVILDENGNSLKDNANYQWDILWEGQNIKKYQFTGVNRDNVDGNFQSIECEISGKFPGIEKKYTRTLRHEVYVWPRPKVYPFNAGESHHVSCGGRKIPVSIRTFGGQKDEWQCFYGKVNEIPANSKGTFFELLMKRESEKNTQPMKEEYELRVINRVEGKIRCDTTLVLDVDVYPSPWMPEDVVLLDRNRNDAPIIDGVREGNVISLSCEECYGGYPNAWEYSWSRNNVLNIGDKHETTTMIELLYTTDAQDDSKTMVYKCNVNNFYNNENWANKEYIKELTIYNRPKTPKALIVKGNGTSGTVIAVIDVTNEDLEEHDYYLVFGYIDSSGQMHDMLSSRQRNPGEVRWSTQIPQEIVNDHTNTLYVYALWKYSNGYEITSGLLRSTDADEYWDGSTYSSTSTRAVIANATSITNVTFVDNNVGVETEEYFSVNGVKSQKPFKGFNILKLNDGSIRKVMVK